jgi:ribosome-associated translation inhibitor RaiA
LISIKFAGRRCFKEHSGNAGMTMMQTPLRISFQGSTPSDALRQMVVEQADGLQRFHDRLTSCHVIVKVPDAHHRSGGHYEVSIHLTLPGNIEVNIDHTPTPDERFGDPLFAVADAFRCARRQIQDRVRRQRGGVKKRHGHIERTLDEPEG